MLNGDAPLPPDLLALVEERFGLEVIGVQPVRSVWRLSTPAEQYCLKRINLAARDLAIVVGLHDFLATAAPGFAPGVIRDTSGRSFLAQGAERFLLLEHLTGREVDYCAAGDLEAAVAGLADFHRLARGYSPPCAWGRKRWYGTWPARLGIRLGDLERFAAMAAAARNRFCREFRRLWPQCQRQALKARAYFTGKEYAVISRRAQACGEICHHDLAHRNILLDGDKTRFVDMDYAIADTVLHDLANLCGHLARLFAWRREPIYAAVAAYRAEVALPAEAMVVLGAMLLWPQELWQLGRQYFDERQPWSEDKYLELLERKCGQTEARLRFFQGLWHDFGLPGRPPG